MRKFDGELLSKKILMICSGCRITEDEIQVLRHRLWCRTAERKTLWEIGQLLRLSRETVIAVEQSALEKLASPSVVPQFKSLLESRTESILQVLSGEQRRLTKDELRTRQSLLDPEDVFLVSAMHGSIVNWLNLNFQSDPHSWYFPKCEEVQAPSFLISQPSDLGKLPREQFNFLLSLIREKERLQLEAARINEVLRDYNPTAARSLLEKLSRRKIKLPENTPAPIQVKQAPAEIKAPEPLPESAGAGAAPSIAIAASEQEAQPVASSPAVESLPLADLDNQSSSDPTVLKDNGQDIRAEQPEATSSIPIRDPEKSLKAARAFLGLDG